MGDVIPELDNLLHWQQSNGDFQWFSKTYNCSINVVWGFWHGSLNDQISLPVRAFEWFALFTDCAILNENYKALCD